MHYIRVVHYGVIMLSVLVGCNGGSIEQDEASRYRSPIPGTSYIVYNDGSFITIADTLSNNAVRLYLSRRMGNYEIHGCSIKHGDRLSKKLFNVGFDSTGNTTGIEYWTSDTSSRVLLKRGTMWFNQVGVDSFESYAQW